MQCVTALMWQARSSLQYILRTMCNLILQRQQYHRSALRNQAWENAIHARELRSDKCSPMLLYIVSMAHSPGDCPTLKQKTIQYFKTRYFQHVRQFYLLLEVCLGSM